MIDINEKRKEKEAREAAYAAYKEEIDDEIIAAGRHFDIKCENGVATQADVIEWMRRVAAARERY